MTRPPKPMPPLVKKRSRWFPDWPLPPLSLYDTPDTWHCAYCDRANPGDRLTCAGCQAGRQVRVARVRVTTYKGVPLSELSEAEREEAAEYARPRLIFQVPVAGIECGSTTTAQHTIIQRMKTFVGIR